MRVMVLVKATEDSEKGFFRTPDTTEMLEAMGRFNDELRKAGILLAADGLKPSSQGKRVAFDGPGRTVIDGPFAATRELVETFDAWKTVQAGFECAFGQAAAADLRATLRLVASDDFVRACRADRHSTRRQPQDG